MKRSKLVSFLNDTLLSSEFQDYGPNGLQIEGRDEVTKVAFAVSATRESIEYAVNWKAHALITHHGLFWRHQGAQTLTGALAKRVFPLVRNEINLISYHLPLDAHPEFGNASTLAKKIGLTQLRPFGDYKSMPTGVCGSFKSPLKESELQKILENVLKHPVLINKVPHKRPISSLGIITGGANNDWVQAKRLGLDAYLTGEISEYNWHDSREAGIYFFAGGHNATESFGVQALQTLLEEKYNLETKFFPSENPA